MQEPNQNLYRIRSGRYSFVRADKSVIGTVGEEEGKIGKKEKITFFFEKGPGGVFGVVSLFHPESKSVANVISEVLLSFRPFVFVKFL